MNVDDIVSFYCVMTARLPKSTRTYSLFPYTSLVRSVIRLPRAGKAWFQPDNEPQNNMWFWIDLPAMAAHAGARDAAPVYLDAGPAENPGGFPIRSEEHKSELQSLMRISYAVFCLKKKIQSMTTKSTATTLHINI